MSKHRTSKPFKRLKTGTLSRQWAMTRAGLDFGARALTQSARELITDRDSPAARERRQRNVQRFVDELGTLKGGPVKAGQILATYGEYLLPPEAVEALHGMAENTPPLPWSAIEPALQRRLGKARMAELDIDPEPLAAASLAQVHRATHRESGEALCLKIQYPGVARTIDADFNHIIRLLKWARLLGTGPAINDWLGDIRGLLHQEVDYHHERAALERTAQRLAGDQRFVVPRVYPAYCTEKVLTMSFEPGVTVSDPAVGKLSQKRRDALGQALLELFFTELFDWGEMQTDPNFGNYRVRIPHRGPAQWVLLDFGAMRPMPVEFTAGLREMIIAACERDRERFLEQAIALGFMQEDFPEQVLADFAEVGMLIVEPLRGDTREVPPEALNSRGDYRWREAQLPKRAAKRALQASLSRYFALPPKEFLYLMRKLMGVYALIATLDGQFSGEKVLLEYLQ